MSNRVVRYRIAGTIRSLDAQTWEIQVEEVRKPAAGVIVHVGKVVRGNPQVDDEVSCSG